MRTSSSSAEGNMKSVHKGNVNQAGDVSLIIRESQNCSG